MCCVVVSMTERAYDAHSMTVCGASWNYRIQRIKAAEQ